MTGRDEDPVAQTLLGDALQPLAPCYCIWGFAKIRGTFLVGSHIKEYNILGSILGSPHFGKLPFLAFTHQYRYTKAGHPSRSSIVSIATIIIRIL